MDFIVVQRLHVGSGHLQPRLDLGLHPAITMLGHERRGPLQHQQGVADMRQPLAHVADFHQRVTQHGIDLGDLVLLPFLHVLVKDALGDLQRFGAQFLQPVGAVVDQRLDEDHEDVGGTALAPLRAGDDGVHGVQVGKANGDQQVLGQHKPQRRGFVLAFAGLFVWRHRHRDGEDAVLILKPAGEFDFLQLVARRDVELVIAAGLGDLLAGGIVQVHPSQRSAGLVFLEHANLLSAQ